MENKKIQKRFFESLNYVRKCKNYIWAVVGVFFIFSIIGFFIAPPPETRLQILELIKGLIAQIEGMTALELIWFIFANNVQSSFLGLIFGFFLGIFPMMVAVGNGYLLGFVAEMSVSDIGFLSLWRILPHGIFELPAVFIALGMGMRFGTFVFEKKRWKSFKELLGKSLLSFVFVVVPLLIIAAIIEGLLIAFF